MIKRKKSNRFPLPSAVSAVDFDETIEIAEEYLVHEQPDQVLATLEQLSPRQQRQPYVYYLRGVAKVMMGAVPYGIADLQIASQQMKKFPFATLNLATACMSIGWLRLGWYYAEQFLKRRPNDPEAEQTAREIIAFAQAEFQRQAPLMGVSVEQLKKAAFPHERAQLALNLGEYKRVLNETQKAIRMIPTWPSPRNNRTLAYFFLGRMKDAEREAREVLEKINPENIHALGNLVKIFTSTLQWEKARPHAEKVIAVTQDADPETLDVSRVIEILAEWEDGEALWAFGKRVLDNFDAYMLPAKMWYAIGAAAANTGHWQDARKAFEYSNNQGGYIKSWVDAGLKASKQKTHSKRQAFASGLDGRFLLQHFSHFLPDKLFSQLIDEMETTDDNTIALRKFTRRYPFAAGAYRLMLWDASQAKEEPIWQELALDALAACETPGAYEEIRKFAQSQYGKDEDRIYAARLLVENGQHDPSEPFRMWVASQQEWHDVLLTMQELREPDGPPCNPETMDLIARSIDAVHDGNLNQAVQFLEQAVELEPDCAVAVHNLGAQYMNIGKQEKGEALIKRSVEVDPDYLFGYTTLAELALMQGDIDAGWNYLQPVLRAPTVMPEVMERSLNLQARLFLANGDIKASKQALHTLEDIFPDSQYIESIRALLRLHNIGELWQKRIAENDRRYRNRELKKPIATDEPLASCLDRVSKDRLSATVAAWGLPKQSAERKAKRIKRLVKTITNPENLADYVNTSLKDEHRAALKWLLENEGIRPWKEFTAKFGDDENESPYWNWHQPESIPGILRMSGLLSIGMLDGQTVALIPAELRPMLQELFPHS